MNNTIFTGLEENFEAPGFGRFETARLIQNRKSKIIGLLGKLNMISIVQER